MLEEEECSQDNLEGLAQYIFQKGKEKCSIINDVILSISVLNYLLYKRPIVHSPYEEQIIYKYIISLNIGHPTQSKGAIIFTYSFFFTTMKEILAIVHSKYWCNFQFVLARL